MSLLDKLPDKFCVIENHINDESKVISRLENYFENFLTADIKILIPDYINMVIWFERNNITNIIDCLQNQIKMYLNQRRTNIRTLIKKDTFELSGLNKFLQEFFSKLETINNIISNSSIFIIGIQNLTKFIISDSMILLFIENIFVSLDNDIRPKIIEFIEFCNKISKYDNMETLNKIIITFTNVFKKQLLIQTNYPLPINIKRIQKLNDTIDYFIAVTKYFNFMDSNFNKMYNPIHHSIMENLTDIIKNNTLNETYYVLLNIWPILRDYINKSDFEDKQKYFSNISNEIIMLVDKSLKNKDFDNILTIISIYKYIDEILQDKTDKDVIRHRLSSIFASEGVLDKIHQYINTMVIAGNIEDILELFSFIPEIKEKDLFINKYYELLIRRLLNSIVTIKDTNINKYIDMELKVVNCLKIKFGDMMVYKITKVINDTLQSSYDNIELLQGKKNITVITSSYNMWDINMTEGLVNSTMVDMMKDTILGKLLLQYNMGYDVKYENKRVINWFPHLGEITITYLNTVFKMLPIQFMLLELFTNTNSMNINDVKASKFLANYDKKFIDDIIGSLIMSGLFKYQTKNLILTDMLVDTIETNLIKVFFTCSDYMTIWEEKREESFVMERVEIVNTNINSILKKASMDKVILFDHLKDQIKIFTLDNTLYEKSLKYMIENDYIQNDGNNMMKLLW